MPYSDALLDKVARLPESPGVYLWRNAEGTVLYVGKAKRLRSRCSLVT
jgi:excinuclease ABC subunit C